jgi:hypothetical protein
MNWWGVVVDRVAGVLSGAVGSRGNKSTKLVTEWEWRIRKTMDARNDTKP